MKSSDEYFNESGQKLHFTMSGCEFDFEGISVSFEDMPYLKDENTDESYLPECARVVVEQVIEGAKQQSLTEVKITPPEHLINQRFSFCNNFPFKYSALEYYFIPGLIREWNDGFLTPVYFNLEVLNKYSQHPDYDLKVMSSTYGSLYYKDQWHIVFGINRNKKIIMWLGDIDKLPDNEKYYLLSENITPDFEIHSEFYEAQICVKWAEGALENQVFKIREELSELVEEKYGYALFKLEGEISKVVADLQKPIFWENRHVSPVIESLNRVFVESLCEKSIKAIVREKCPNADIKGMRGLKLFSKLLTDVLEIDNADVLMCPFFVLYDYRIIMCHLQSDETSEKKMNTIFERLNIDVASQNNEIVYMTLFEVMNSSLTSIISSIKQG